MIRLALFLKDPDHPVVKYVDLDRVLKGVLGREQSLSQAGGDAGVFGAGQAAMIIQNASRDGRTDVTCTDYGRWTQAWTEVKG